jgi:N-acetylmuramoyl-L-alanine amidase
VTDTGVPVVVLEDAGDSKLKVMTPCGREATVSGGAPLHGATVVIDPGHGGINDPGARAPTGLYERDLNMTVSRALAAELRVRGIDVVLTRTDDYGTTLAVRSALADALNAALMVSVHHNAPTFIRSAKPGTEVFVQTGSDDSARLGGFLLTRVRDALSRFDIAWSTAGDAGVMTVREPNGEDSYGMIRRPETTTALIELGYISNPAEAELFETHEYTDTAADALADAIEAYLAGAPYDGPVGGRTFVAGRAPGKNLCIDPPLEP